jgi:hypothetical protein
VDRSGTDIERGRAGSGPWGGGGNSNKKNSVKRCYTSAPYYVKDNVFLCFRLHNIWYRYTIRFFLLHVSA